MALSEELWGCGPGRFKSAVQCSGSNQTQLPSVWAGPELPGLGVIGPMGPGLGSGQRHGILGLSGQNWGSGAWPVVQGICLVWEGWGLLGLSWPACRSNVGAE